MAKQNVLVARNGAELAEALHGYNPEKSVSFFCYLLDSWPSPRNFFALLSDFIGGRYGRTSDPLSS